MKVVPVASRTAASAEARMIALSTMSGRFKCCLSCSAPTIGAGRARVIALWCPHYPFAIRAVEERGDEFAVSTFHNLRV